MHALLDMTRSKGIVAHIYVTFDFFLDPGSHWRMSFQSGTSIGKQPLRSCDIFSPHVCNTKLTIFSSRHEPFAYHSSKTTEPALINATTTSFGSVCLGALFIAIVQFSVFVLSRTAKVPGFSLRWTSDRSAT